MTESALVLFSGGQDSTTCLAWALSRYDHVETVGFTYGQRHQVEMECREPVRVGLEAILPAWQAKLGRDHLIDLSVLAQIGVSALTADLPFDMRADGLPSTFVPGRNLLFFTYAAALGYRRGIRALVGGMCETDYSGYPDCRNETLEALGKAISLGMDTTFTIETPLMWIDKAATWALADQLGGAPLVDLVVEDTHTCYLGIRSRRHAWGYGCGHCPACDLRAKGFEKGQAQKS